ncbi:unnamed protein product [Acanthoscelides obtectus]|uniref:C2H2-type domain-containing protein n=1 Tax=Acanthoscelides obtectus TaxID=200917 RepID=A0A9P0PF68_ACAOB|nr:unnamed protein product [Acanthoscelides obtectus]CAK1681911.1 Zinc finger protein 711 [Acanthoscelides obtectus]
MKEHRNQKSRNMPRLSCKHNTCKHCDAKFASKMNLDNHLIRKHPDLVASVSSKIHKCSYCVYKTTSKSNFVTHMLKHPESVCNYKFSICIHCNAKFGRKTTLNDHIIKKHPDFIPSVSSQIHECAHCAYKTTIKNYLAKHLLKHAESVRNYKFSICIHCNAKFRGKTRLNDHIIKKHPDFIPSVSGKIHECAHCAYKTTIKNYLAKHLLKHPESVCNYKFSICIHCNAKFRGKITLNDHIIKKHPDLIPSVSSKIHECTHCAYKTTIKNYLAKHLLKHSESVRNYKFSICIHCNAKFRGKTILNDHIIKKHPDFIPSISGKIHECKHCDFKATIKSKFVRHMRKHPDIKLTLNST